MAALDLSLAVDRVRLAIADWNDPEILDDDVIEYVLTKNYNNESASIRECAMYILGMLAHDTHQRVDRIEFWGNERFTQYLTYLQKTINNPAFYQIAGVYAGGIDEADVAANVVDTNTIVKEIPSYSNYREVNLDELV